jgi:hypothetical protein
VTELRVGSVDDLDAVMRLFDAAIAWLAEQGRTGQWGDQPWSASADRVARIRRMIEENELLLLDREGTTVGALAHGPVAHDYVPPAPEPEDYVVLLVASSTSRGPAPVPPASVGSASTATPATTGSWCSSTSRPGSRAPSGSR